MYKEFVVLDVETTGVDAKRDDIIEFAAVRLNDGGEVVDRMDILLSTTQAISPTVTALTGITAEDIKDKPPISQVRGRLEDFIGNAPIVGHNVGFDIDFLTAKGCDLKNDVLDTLELAHTVLPAQNYYSLEYLASHFSFPNQPSHRAMDDVMATVDLFKMLVFQVERWAAPTKAAVAELVPPASWSWGWLIATPPPFAKFTLSENEEDDFTNKLMHAAVDASQWLGKIGDAKNSSINLIEYHLPIDPLALALANAIHYKPSVLVVDQAELWKMRWSGMGERLKNRLVRFAGINSLYEHDTEMALAKSGKPLSSLEARLITKITVWRREWEMDPDKLFLSQEERYQWEQKFAPLDNADLSEVTKADVIVAPAYALVDIPALQEREIFTAQPLLLEDYAVFDQSRIFSIVYFNAAISSRRDFAHQHIRPQDIKLADEIFKLLHRISSNFDQLAQELIKIYAHYPPTSVYERDIELEDDMVTSEFKTALSNLISDLEAYVTKLGLLRTPSVIQQIEHSRKLLSHLEALKNLDAKFRYFLYADQNRFFLELIPSRIDFSKLRQLISQARGMTAISPGLSVSGRFDYFKLWLESFHSQVLASPAKSELLLVGEDSQTALLDLTGQLLTRSGVSLVLASSAFEAKDIFDQLYARPGAVLESYDTIGNVAVLPKIIARYKDLVLIGYHQWLRQVRWYYDDFDRVILGRMPFDPISRPRFKVLGGGDNGFEGYTLPRAIMRLKETLHLAKLWNKPMILVDSRLLVKDYGQKVINSLNAFTVIPTGMDEALE